ncbi:unnamed protein product [Leptosia nina]|uniref:Uncharacterized protein n=1 Tax=Leptosia nina TaxID=320188 RepID=A0AAV1IVK6_9NEOP
MRVIVFIAFITAVQSARILGLFAHTGKSHHMVFEPLLKKLATKHEVTVASFFPQKIPIANYTEISLKGLASPGLNSFDLSTIKKPSIVTKIPIVGDVVKLLTLPTSLPNVVDICDKICKLPALVDALQKTYDVVIVETFVSDCMLGLMHVHGINAPVVGLSSTSPFPWANNRVGLMNNPSFMPFILTGMSTQMTFRERMANTLYYGIANLIYYIQDKQRLVIEKHYNMPVPLYDLSFNLTMILLNTFHTLNGVKYQVPGLVEVGGMHLDHRHQRLPGVSIQKLLCY